MATSLIKLFLLVTILMSVGTGALVMTFVYTASSSRQPYVKFCGALIPNPFSHPQTPPLVRRLLNVAGATAHCLLGRRKQWIWLLAAAIVVYLLLWNWGVFSQYSAQDKSLPSIMQSQITSKEMDPAAALMQQHHQLRIPKNEKAKGKRTENDKHILPTGP